MILHGRTVDQVIDRDETASFYKEIVVTGSRVPLAMVRKRAAGGQGTRAPVLLVHGFGQNRYAWHLPARSFANHLARAGFDVYNLDLRGHGRSRHFGARRCRRIEDYVREDLPAAVEEVQAISGSRGVWLVGHSLGGLVAYAAAPALAGAVAGIASIGSPYHFARGSLTLGAITLVFRALALAPLPNAPLPLAPVGVTMRVLRRFAESPLYPIPLRGWHAGSCEPHVLEQHLRLAFDRAALTEMVDLFEWSVDRRASGGDADGADSVERFETMNLPLLVMAGENDDLAPPESVRPGFTLSRARDKTYRVLPLGHIDLLVGRDAPQSTWSVVTSWLTERVA
ncbi:MAG TPA: alpha/beta fold hydrolase [Polyangiaceae bacterium]|nr:alpha/beta fold hydrolase [Polyangiaceae bacterium]